MNSAASLRQPSRLDLTDALKHGRLSFSQINHGKNHNMKWFKHDSNACLDAKLSRVRLKYGMEGYGLYWFCLEAIARTVETHNLTFELEDDAEIISAATGIHYERVQEMMTYMCNQGLFESSGGRITCLKMATRTDEYTQKLLRNPNKIRTVSRHTPDKIPPNRIEQNRIEQNKKESRATTRPTVAEIADYVATRDTKIDPQHFFDYYTANGWKVGKNSMKDWRATVRTWERRENENTKRPVGQNSNQRRVSRADEVRAAMERARGRTTGRASDISGVVEND